MSDDPEHHEENETTSLAPIHFQEHNWPALADLLKYAKPLLVFITSAVSPYVGLATGLGYQIFEVEVNRRAMSRLNTAFQIIPIEITHAVENLAEADADLWVALRDLGDKAVNELFKRKFRYFVELLAGRMSKEHALAKDKHYRFRRWVEQLDLHVLVALSKYSNADAQQTQYKVKSDNVSAFYHQGGAGAGKAVITSLTYAHDLVKGEKTSLWEFIAQLEAVGIVFFDRGGGSFTPGDAATCLWHRDTDGFAGYLRKADERIIWKGEKDDE